VSDLVEQLRRMSPQLDILQCESVLQAADRIEQLEERMRGADALIVLWETRATRAEARIAALEAVLRRIVNGGTMVLLTASMDECPVNPDVLEQIINDARAALVEGDKKSDWLPTISNIIRAALARDTVAPQERADG
jgi:hypothetical protein